MNRTTGAMKGLMCFILALLSELSSSLEVALSSKPQQYCELWSKFMWYPTFRDPAGVGEHPELDPLQDHFIKCHEFGDGTVEELPSGDPPKFWCSYIRDLDLNRVLLI